MSYYRNLSLVLFILTNNFISAQGVDFLKFISGAVVNTNKNTHELTIIFDIAEGYHIQSNDPNSDTVIPTRISIEALHGIMPGEPGFPEAGLMHLEGFEEPLQVFTGSIEINIPINYSTPIRRDTRIPGLIYYQACDDKRCFYPRELQFEVVLE